MSAVKLRPDTRIVMDPIAHTLVGATLAETGLGRLARRATPTLIIAANLPDIDAFCQLVSMDFALLHRRGWTHGVLAMAVLPWLLAAVMRWWPDRGGAPLRFWPLLGVAYVGVVSHPFLDWLNTYGVRLLMPFDGRWFYGDALFIVDPWLWLMAAAAVVFAHSASRRGQRRWILVALLLSSVVIASPSTPWPAVGVWLLGVAGIVWVRRRRGSRPAPWWARSAVVAMAVYIALMLSITERAYGFVDRSRSRHYGFQVVMAGPVPARPFVRDVILVDTTFWVGHPETYLAYQIYRPGQKKELVLRGHATDEDLAKARAAYPGFMNWVRFPAYSYEDDADGRRLTIREVRYPNRRSGFAVVTVPLDPQPVAPQ